jgi:hypothetical protein
VLGRGQRARRKGLVTNESLRRGEGGYQEKKQCCGYGMFIPYPKTSTKERGAKKFVIIPFFVATNFTK